MRQACLWLVLALLLFPGCTSDRLRRSVVNQAGTLTTLQYEQVLCNLAMTSIDPSSVPSQVSVRDGSAQIADYGTAGTMFDTGNSVITHPTLAGSRTVVEQWGVRPLTDDTELKLIRMCYQRALGSPVSLQSSLDFTNDLAHELKKQITEPENIDLRLEDNYVTGAFTSGPNGVNQAQELNKQRLELQRQQIEDEEKLNSIQAAIYKLEHGGSDPLAATAIAALKTQKNDLTKAIENRKIDLDRQMNYILRDASSVVEARVSIAQIAQNRFDDTTISTNDEKIIQTDEFQNGLSQLVIGQVPKKNMRVTASAKEVRRQIKQVESDLLEIEDGWVHLGCADDVPRDACYVGRFGDRYAWVCRDGLEPLAELTLKVFNFSSMLKDSSVVTIPGGPRYTPTPSP